MYRLDNFIESSINPITSLPYDENWVVFVLTDSKEYNMFVGRINDCAYTVKFSRYSTTDWHFALCDFIDYNKENNKEILLVLKQEELEEARKIYSGHSFKENILRNYEPKILVHSTTFENYINIVKDGKLKSFNNLNLQSEPIGTKLGDPKDFQDYIMFYGGGFTGEIVVNSKQKGKIVMNENDEYLPGARLYFDAEQIASDGLLIRDGCHIKVRSELSLSPYLIFTATAESVGLNKKTSTPKEFSQLSDKLFQSLFSKEFCYD